MSRSTMVSPSSSIRNFTVPCVAGWDGPMLSTWCSVCRSFSRSSSSALVWAIGSVPRSDQRLAPLLRIVLAQGVTLELLVQQDAAQVGMVAEADPVQVPDLALHPVGGGPQLDHRVDLAGRLGNAGLDPHALVPGERVEVVDHLEARLAAELVDRGQIAQHRELEAGLVAQEAQHLDDAARLDPRGGVAALGVRREHRAAEDFEKPAQRRRAEVFHQERFSIGACWRSYSPRRNSSLRLSSASGTSRSG